MIRRSGLALAITLVGLFTIGCGDDDDSADDGFITARELMQRIAPSYCDRLATCSPDGFASAYASKQACIDKVVGDTRPGESGDRSTEAQASACKQKVETASCETLTSALSC